MFSQNETKKWYFGDNAALDFMTSPPTILTNCAMPGNQSSSACMADAAGNILFYTNGLTVWNRLHVVMANGSGLLGHFSSWQGVEIIKQPGNTNLYYIFITPGSLNGGGLSYSIVDMNLAAGMGSVTVKNANLYSGACADKLTAIKHCNGVDVWVLSLDYNSLNFNAHLLSSSGANTIPVVSSAGSSAASSFGCMKISPNGKKLGISSSFIFPVGQFQLYDFDNSSGIVSNPIVLGTSPGNPWGCEFSPDGTRFYGSANGSGLYQWDLCAGSSTAIAASKYTVNSGPNPIYSLQLAANGKIYGGSGSSYISVINNPNVLGAGCNFVVNGQSLGTGFDVSDLPNFMGSYFLQRPVLPPFTYTVSNGFGCQGAMFNSVTTQTSVGCAASGYTLTHYTWDFGDPSSGSANTSTLTSPVHAFTSLGTYTVKLIYYYTCGGGTDTLSQVVNVNQSCIAVSNTSITCASLGSATVNATFGTGPFSYTWMPTAQTGSAASGLSPGTYTISVFDFGSNLTYTATTVFTSLIPLTGNLNNSSSITCNGANTATASVTGLAGGSGTVNYVWFNTTISYTSATPLLGAGLWSVTVSDALTGCQINQNFYISQPPPLSLNLSSNTPTSCAGSNIVLTGTNSGGTPFTSGPGYTYTWSAALLGNTVSVSETTAGTYIYTLSSSDANNCLTSNTISVDFVPNPTLSVTDVSICPLTVGTLTVSGASSYSWSSTSTTLSVTGSSFTDSPVSSGQYSVIGSALGCSSMATASIIVMLVPNPFISTNSPRCEGSSLFLNALGGASYLWSGSNGFNSVSANNNFNALSLTDAGVYNVTVTAANSCTATATKTIVVNPIPTLSATGSTVCTSQTLNLNAISTATTFVWTGPLSFTSTSQNPFITNPLIINTGTYTVKVTSAQGCTNTAIAIASVVLPPSLTAQLSSYSLCSQAFNGSPNTITLTAGGANTYTLVTVPDMFNANPAGPISPLTAIPPNTGAASATLSGSNGVCTVTAGLTFSIIPNPTVSVGSNTPVICAGDTYTYTSQGAGSYSWSSATPGFTTYNNGGVAVASPSIHSVFSVFGASLGCNSASETSTITVNPLPLINLLPTSPTVCIGSKVNLIATGTGNGYTWTPYLNINSMYGSTVNAFPNIQQTYTVVGSLNSCTSTAMITVSVLTLPSPIATVLKPTVCLNETITLQGLGGETYQWYGPNSIYHEGQTVNLTANSYIYAGIYTLTVADKNNCKASALTSVTINSLPDGSLLGTQMQGCVPFKSEFNYYSALATSTNIATLWTVDSKLFTTKTFSNEFKVPGNYTITGNFRDTLTNCLNTRTFFVEAYPVPMADFSFLPEKPIENLEEVIFTNTSKGEEQKKWDWFFVNNQGYRSQNKNTEYLFTEAGLYPIAMIVTNTWGCADTVVKSLKIESDLTVYVPNVFTPNGDDLNEVFLPITRAIKSYELLVFDRWGTKIFSTTNTEVGWDGSYRGEQCKVDVYVWKINLSSVNGEMKTLTGNVMLSR